MSPGIKAAKKLSSLGYRFELAGDRLRYQYEGPGEPDLAQVRSLLGTVKANKPEVLAYLTKPARPERILTCFECPMHEHDTINPSQGWGRCLHRGKGCYGLLPACAEGGQR